jgi:hypothetical protein
MISAILVSLAAMLIAECGTVSSAPRWYTDRSRLPSCGALTWDAAPLDSPVGRSAVRCLVTAQATGRQAELDVQGQPDTDGTIDVALRVIDRQHVVMMARFYHYQHGGNRWSVTECATFQSPSVGSSYANLGAGCGPEQAA